MQVSGAISLRNLKRMDRSGRTHQQRLHAEPMVVIRAGWRRKIEYYIHFAHIERLADVLFDQRKPRLRFQMRQVRDIARA